MKSKLLKPGQSLLEEKIEHLEMTLVQMQNDLAMAHMVLQTHGTLFQMLKMFFKKFEAFEAGQDKKGNYKDGQSGDQSQHEASDYREDNKK